MGEGRSSARLWRVSEALSPGYELYGSHAATFNGDHVVGAQATLWPVKGRADIDGGAVTQIPEMQGTSRIRTVLRALERNKSFASPGVNIRLPIVS